MRIIAVSTALLYAVTTAQTVEECREDTPTPNATDVPYRFGIVLFRAADPIDYMGPDEVLFTLGRYTHVERSFIGEKLDPVTSEPLMPNRFNSSTWVSILPTHTFATAPEVDVLLVPGGAGARNPNLTTTIDFVRDTFPKVKYLMTVCTGAMIAAKAGILDGRRATTNKQAWLQVIALSNTTEWIGDARWVVDENVWTASGVASGIDAMLAFVRCKFGPALARNVTNAMEYMANSDPTNDPWAVYPNGTYIDPTLLTG